MSENSKKASVLVSDKKPAFFEKNRFTGFYIFIVGHGQNIPKIPQNCILTTPCLKNSTSTSCATPLRLTSSYSESQFDNLTISNNLYEVCTSSRLEEVAKKIITCPCFYHVTPEG